MVSCQQNEILEKEAIKFGLKSDESQEHLEF